MPSSLGTIFSQLGHILGVCPRCDEVFYLPEARPYLDGKRPQSVVDKIQAEERRLERAEDKLAEMEALLREAASVAGLRMAKKLLKKIDPTFSGAGYDPHDVKVLFDPVTYVVFNGMSRGKLRDIVLLAKPPETSATERVYRSINRAIDNGNIEFKTLHVDDAGKIVHR